MRCYVSADASRDLDAIGDYFVERSVEAGERLLQEFVKKCERLIQFPKMGRSYEQVKAGLRGIPLDGYIIFYKIVEDGIEVLRVLNGRQDLEAIFEDEE